MKESAGNHNFALQAAELLEVGCSFKKKIQIEQQKITVNDQRIKFLQKEIEQMKQENKLKQQKLKHVQELIEQQKNKFQGESQSEDDSINLEVIKQLREHFKAIRFQYAQMLEDEEEDDVDVDNMTYEELLELGQKIGKVSKGVQQNKIQELKKIPFVKKQSKDHECTICRDEFNQQDQCIQLSCSHLFHVQCAKQWLKMEKVCPNCKSQIV